MQTLIGCIGKDNAGRLFEHPDCPGPEFREMVDIYAGGDEGWLSMILPGYVAKLKRKCAEGDCLVIARSFMTGPGGPGNGRSRRGGRPDGPPPMEMFDIAYCVPLEAITDEMIENFDAMVFSKRGRHM